MADEKTATDNDQYQRATRLTFLFLVIYLAVQHFYAVQPENLSYTAFKEQVATGQIKKVSIKNETSMVNSPPPQRARPASPPPLKS